MIKTKKYLWLWVSLGFTVLLLACLAVLLFAPAAAEQPPQTTEATTLPPPEENVFSPEDFAYDGDYMTCLTSESILGIDVSSYQKNIDWEQVKAAGVEFVIIRVGYRGYATAGKLAQDKLAQSHYEGAKNAGLKVGCYFFSQAISVEEAIEEANFAMEIIRDWQVELPLIYDWELVDESYRNGCVDARLLTDMSIAFCQTVEAAGYSSMVYFNPDQSRRQLYLEELTDYGFWLAMYSDTMNYDYKVDMWQYTCTGSVPGIEGNVDLNLYFPYAQ